MKILNRQNHNFWKNHLFLPVFYLFSNLYLASSRALHLRAGRHLFWQQFCPRGYPQNTLWAWGDYNYKLLKKTWSLTSWQFSSCPWQLSVCRDGNQSQPPNHHLPSFMNLPISAATMGTYLKCMILNLKCTQLIWHSPNMSNCS